MTITNYNFPNTPQLKIRVSKKQDVTVWFAVKAICKATGIIRPQRMCARIWQRLSICLVVRPTPWNRSLKLK